MTSLWIKIRDAIEHECETIQTLLAPLEAKLKPVAEQDLKDIVSAGTSAALAAVVGEPLTLTTAEHAAIVGGRAALAVASTKGIELSEQTALGVATLAGLTPPTVQ